MVTLRLVITVSNESFEPPAVDGAPVEFVAIDETVASFLVDPELSECDSSGSRVPNLFSCSAARFGSTISKSGVETCPMIDRIMSRL